mgnify:CR=1 FL=1
MTVASNLGDEYDAKVNLDGQCKGMMKTLSHLI